MNKASEKAPKPKRKRLAKKLGNKQDGILKELNAFAKQAAERATQAIFDGGSALAYMTTSQQLMSYSTYLGPDSWSPGGKGWLEPQGRISPNYLGPIRQEDKPKPKPEPEKPMSKFGRAMCLTQDADDE